MSIFETEAKSILRKHKRVDSWFISCYGMNLYRGCAHNCVYCDGRAEKYNVEGEFGKDVAVKVNAIDILKRELDPARKRKPFKRCYFMLGGGVGDSYQPVEKKYLLTRRALELLQYHEHSVSVLTKSTLVQRDIDLICDVNSTSRAMVSFSFSSVDDSVSSLFEPMVPPPSERLKVIEEFSKSGVPCGMFLMPVLPLITDKPEMIDDAVRSAKEHGANFVIFSGMTLKDGRQRTFFTRKLTESYPELAVEYDSIYTGSKWGAPTEDYSRRTNEVFAETITKHRLPPRIPRELFQGLLSENDYVSVILDQIDYLLRLRGSENRFGYTSYQVSQLEQRLSGLRDAGMLGKVKGFNEETVEVVEEILNTGTCKLYEDNIYG